MGLRGGQEKDIQHNGNISIEDVIEIARIMRDRSCARELKGTVRASPPDLFVWQICRAGLRALYRTAPDSCHAACSGWHVIPGRA